MTIPTEEEINKEIKNAQDIIDEAQKKLEKLKKSIQ